MPFKIVQTIEKGETCLTVIPAQWEKDGILYWPKKSAVAKLSLDEKSVPSETWESINCVRKRILPTRREAELELEKMEGLSDTEIDETSFLLPPPPAKRLRPQNPVNVVRDRMMDFNHLIEESNIMQNEAVQVEEYTVKYI